PGPAALGGKLTPAARLGRHPRGWGPRANGERPPVAWRGGILWLRAVGSLALAAMATGYGAPRRPAPGGMARLAGGTFTMGTQASRIDGLCRRFGTTHRDLFLPETPAHVVTLRPFLIDRKEVTNSEFKRFVDRHPEWAPGRPPAERQNGDYLKHWTGGGYPEGAAEAP